MPVFCLVKFSYRRAGLFAWVYFGLPWPAVGLLVGPAFWLLLSPRVCVAFAVVGGVRAISSACLLGVLSPPARYGCFVGGLVLLVLSFPSGFWSVEMLLVVAVAVGVLMLPFVVCAVSSSFGLVGVLVQLGYMSVVWFCPGSISAVFCARLVLSAWWGVAPDLRGHSIGWLRVFCGRGVWSFPFPVMLGVRRCWGEDGLSRLLRCRYWCVWSMFCVSCLGGVSLPGLFLLLVGYCSGSRWGS
ncbi:hypothetical protein AZ036_004403 [Klebsiella michiganensis]|nr:hypothetical protein AZ036_004403 [Klebsiella michiganensis]